jgi:hypothetical protein
MDERKNKLKELEDGKKSDLEARDRLFESLGEALILRIGDEEPFEEPFIEDSGSAPGDVLKEYRKLRKEIADSEEIIYSLKAEADSLKKLDGEISAKEEKQSALKKELEEAHVQLGKALLLTLNNDELPESIKLEKERLLLKIEEQEGKLGKLEEQKSGFFSSLGVNAQAAVYKTMLLKHRSDLERLYRKTGKKFSSDETAAPDSEAASGSPEGEAALTSGMVRELRTFLASLDSELSLLREERRKLIDSFGIEGSPSRRIHALEKHISHVKKDFAAIYLSLGSMAGDKNTKIAFAPFLREEDSSVFEKTDKLTSQIAKKDLAMEKINASIAIDNEMAEIEKLNKSILGQKKKITDAEEAIVEFEKIIADSQLRIEELKAFIKKNHGG